MITGSEGLGENTGCSALGHRGALGFMSGRGALVLPVQPHGHLMGVSTEGTDLGDLQGPFH